MEKHDGYQLELFSQSKERIHLRDREPGYPFSSFIRTYEKTILIIIGIITTGIISFGLGVERGKKISLTRFNSRFDFAQATKQPVKSSAVKKNVISDSGGKEAIKVEEKKQPRFLEKQGFIIQLASYKNKNLAEKEAESLKKRGVSALVMSKGGFAVLYVGNIANKEIALSMLPELKKIYRDCYIRRL